MTEIYKYAYSLVNPEQKKKEWHEELEEQICSYCPKMTFQQRIYGCLFFFLVGFLISMGSTFRIIQLLQGHPESFATMYTLGNIVSICSTCFMFGPWSQCKKMVAPTRLVATSAYFFFMGVTLFLAFYPEDIPQRVLMLVLAILCQFMALLWYTLSFIPFAREMVKSCCKNTFCRSCFPQDEDFWA